MMPALGRLTWWLLCAIAWIVTGLSPRERLARRAVGGCRPRVLVLAATWAAGLAECLPALGLPQLCRQALCRLDPASSKRERDLDGDAAASVSRTISLREFHGTGGRGSHCGPRLW